MPPAEFCSGDCEGDAQFRSRFHRWLAAIRDGKDAQIAALLRP